MSSSRKPTHIKVRNDGLQQPDSYEAKLDLVTSEPMSEARLFVYGWGRDEAEAMKHFNSQVKILIQRLQYYLTNQ